MKFKGMQAFYVILCGQLLSVIGSGMTRFGLSVWVFEQTGSASAFSRLIFFAVIPMALGSLFAGPWVDRLPRRQIMIWGNIIASSSTLLVVLLLYSGNLAQWHLYISLLINGVANAFLVPAFEASVPLLVPKEQLARASGLSQMVAALDPILSPALAGMLVTSLGLGAVFIADIVTFLCGVTALLLCIIPNPEKQMHDVGFWQDFRSGWDYLWQRKPFFHLIILMSVLMFMQGAAYALTGPLVLNFSDANALGWCYAGFGMGALTSGLIVGIWGGPKRSMNGIIIGLIIAAIGSVLSGLSAKVWFIALGFFLFGAGFILISTLNRVIYQLKAAPEILGRLLSLRIVIGVSLQGVGILLSGWLVSRFFEPLLQEKGALANSLGKLVGVGAGRGAALFYILVGICLMVLFLWSLQPRVRLLEDALPDHDV